jgi:hypothetical protein
VEAKFVDVEAAGGFVIADEQFEEGDFFHLLDHTAGLAGSS